MTYDLLVTGGTIIDGTGSQPRRGDVGIRDGRMVAVAPVLTGSARTVIDAQGLMVCPGFIDVHAHDDLAVLHDPLLSSKRSQGVTTTIVGNCGLAPTPMAVDIDVQHALRAYVEPVLGAWEGELGYTFANVPDYLDHIDHTARSVNVGVLAAHGPLRIKVMGFANRAATEAELSEMTEMLRASLQAGALGLSFGLMYAPGCFATKEELVALASVAASCGAVVTAHIRGEGDLLLSSIQEMIEIAQASGASLHISHLKAVGLRNWGSVTTAIARIESARLAGLDVTCDAYPYTAGSTTILSLLPPWALEGGSDQIVARVKNPAVRARIREDLTRAGDGWDNVAWLTGFDRVVVTSGAKDYQGRSIHEIAMQRGCADVDAYLDVIVEMQARGTIVIHHMSDEDVKEVLRYDHTLIGSDGLPSTNGHPHPRLYGTFPRFLATYVRDAGLMSLEAAVARVTAKSAERFGLADRGRIAPGYFADLTIFDLASMADRATYEDPMQFAQGIRYVVVNGEVVVGADGDEARPGKGLRRRGRAVT